MKDSQQETTMIAWPERRPFGFTIVDDTDKSTVANTAPIYEFLADLGMRITKTVWPLRPTLPACQGGDTLENANYRRWIESLQAGGFEIAMHGATDHTSERRDVIRGFDAFREVLGHDPRMYINHVGQREAMYWGEARLDGWIRMAYRIAKTLYRGKCDRFFGHVEGSPYFWGDICRERVTYMRNLVFPAANTLACDSHMPYHDPRRPYVRFWFSGSDGAGVRRFCRLLDDEAQDRLVASGGACVVYTHLGSGFVSGGRLDDGFKSAMTRLAGRGGWYAPASTLLDHLRAQPGWRATVSRTVASLTQLHWLMSQVRRLALLAIWMWAAPEVPPM